MTCSNDKNQKTPNVSEISETLFANSLQTAPVAVKMQSVSCAAKYDLNTDKAKIFINKGFC